jgi:hypothetical protein
MELTAEAAKLVLLLNAREAASLAVWKWPRDV